MKRLIYLLLSIALILTLAVGCDKAQDETSGKTDKPAATTKEETPSQKDTPKDVQEISVMLFDRANIPDSEGTIDNNRWTKYLNENMADLGIHVTFEPLPRSEESSKIPVLMASGTASDVMMTYNNALVESFYKDGGTVDLAPYVEEFGADLKEYLGEKVLSAGRLPDGAQFAIPARRAIYTRHNSFVRKDWLDALGMDIPTTPDEYLDMLRAFKTEDPGNVGDELIPYWKGSNLLRMAFLEELDETSYQINQDLLYYADPGAKEYLRFMNTIYNEGLTDPEYFAEQNFGQREREAVARGALGAWDSNTNANVDALRGSLLQTLRETVPEADFVGISVLKNVNDGKIHNDSYPLTGGFNFVPKTAEHPDAVVKYLNFLAGEGGFTIFHGIEGEHFEFDGDVPVVIDGEYNAKTKDWGRHDFFLVGNQGYYATPEDFAAATAKEIPGYEDYVIKNYAMGGEGTVYARAIYKTELEIEQSGNLDKIHDDYEVKLITCKPDEFDGIFEEYVVELERYGAKEIIEQRTAYFKN